MKKLTVLAAGAALAIFASGTAMAQQTLAQVKQRGQVICGVSQSLPGFANPDAQGNWAGFDVDMCKSVAAAIFGDTKRVKYVPTTARERFTALQSGEVDFLARNTTWTMSRDTQLGFDFVGINFYDGQGFMVRKDLNVKNAKQLAGAAVCTQTGTTTELNVADFFRSNKMDYKVVAFEKNDEVLAAYDSGRCDVFTTDRSGLAADRTKLKDPNAHIILPDVISKEPLGPLVRHGDNNWGDIIRWAFFAMVNAEELGITAANVDQMLNSPNPEIKRLLGKEGDFGKMLGLENNWAYNVIKMVGNYAESYERNVGTKTPIGLERGVNALWTAGGLQYAPPVR
ncbi:MAG: amino acid ABC transporter substrate-binding protein [Alphaproteobacteria bacterium]|nr:amino acid ABC transporter substrate-binding protein [Alphaproteobacteria bacterium]